MTSALKHADRPHSSVLPRWRDRARDAHHFGPIQPLETPRRSFWQRVMGRGA